MDFEIDDNGRAEPGDGYWNDGAGCMPIGDDSAFAHHTTITFDGNGHTILSSPPQADRSQSMPWRITLTVRAGRIRGSRYVANWWRGLRATGSVGPPHPSSNTLAKRRKRKTATSRPRRE